MWKSKFYGAFMLNHRVGLHAIDATPARWRGDAGFSPPDRARTAALSPRSAPDAPVDLHTANDGDAKQAPMTAMLEAMPAYDAASIVVRPKRSMSGAATKAVPATFTSITSSEDRTADVTPASRKICVLK